MSCEALFMEVWRRKPESNRSNWICSPRHNRFAISPKLILSTPLAMIEGLLFSYSNLLVKLLCLNSQRFLSFFSMSGCRCIGGQGRIRTDEKGICNPSHFLSAT